MDEIQAKYLELRSELDALKRRERGRNRLLVGLSVFALAFSVVTAGAQSAITQLHQFSSGQPAIAQEVNDNFSLIESWFTQLANDKVDLLLANDAALQATTSSGGTDSYLWPRKADDGMYMNYGSGGFWLRDNKDEVKLALDAAGVVTVTEAMLFDCPDCGSTTALDGDTDWGDLSIQGRVLSTNANLHLSPPGGSNVVINDLYRAAGGTKDGDAGLQVQGSVSYGGHLKGWTLRDAERMVYEGTRPLGVRNSSGTLVTPYNTSDTICFLTHVNIDHNGADIGRMQCNLYPDSNGDWQLYVDEGNGGDLDVNCEARCITF